MKNYSIFIALCISTAVTSVTAQQIETFASCTEGSEPLPINYGNHTVNCEINPVTDVDRFSFAGSNGDNVRIIIRSNSRGFDPRLEIRDSSGALIEDTYCNGGSTSYGSHCTLDVDHTLTQTGTYLLTLSDQGSSEIGGYILQVEKYPPAYNPVLIGYDTPEHDVIDPVTDVDFFAFQGAAGTQVRFIVRSQRRGFDPRLEVWDAAGSLMGDTYCDGGSTSYGGFCTVEMNHSLTQTGTYLLALSDLGSSELGNYELNIQCIFGSCPTADLITINPVAGLITSEAGSTDAFTVVLGTEPTADVIIGLASSDLDEAAVSPPSLTFTTGDWDIPQTVTVTGINDMQQDGNQIYNIITQPAASADARFDGVNPSDVIAVNLEHHLFDVDGNGSVMPLEDGLIIIRYLFGFNGEALVKGAIGSGCTACTAEAIKAYLHAVLD